MSSSRESYHHGDLAGALEDAAMQLLATRPAHEISLREVARAAGVSHNAPYHHFTDRRGLLRVLAERSMAELLAEVQRAAAPATTPAEVLRLGGGAYLAFAASRTYAFEAMYDPAVCVPGAPTEAMAPLIEALESMLFAAASDAGLAGAAEARAAWALVHGLATLTAAGHFTREEAAASYDAAVGLVLPAA